EIKVFTRGARRVLRSKDPAGITQEIWALLCACQLTHTTRATAAAAGGHDPDQISYTTTLRALRRAITTGPTPNGTQAEALPHLLPARPRRSRTCPRRRGGTSRQRPPAPGSGRPASWT